MAFTTKLDYNIPDSPKKNNVSSFFFDRISVTGSKTGYVYEILAEDFISEGGEGKLYKAVNTDNSDFSECVVKIYNNGYSKDSDGKKERIADFLMSIDSPEKKGLMPILDYGIARSDVESHYFEIYPLCEAFPKHADYDTIRNKVVPALNSALHIFFENNFVHMDIKPENIYCYDGNVVLGDYGTMEKLSLSSGNRFAQYRTVLSKVETIGYAAPELSAEKVGMISDYFSLGCTLATLYNHGKHVYESYINNYLKGSYGKHNIYDQIQKSGLPIVSSKDKDYDLQILVDSLVLGSDERASCNDIDEWLKDKEKFVKSWVGKIENARSKAGGFKYNFKEKFYYSQSDLTDAFLENWEEAIEHCFESDSLKKYLDSNEFLGGYHLSKEFTTKVNSPLSRELLFAQFLCTFNSSKSGDSKPCIYWRSHRYNSYKDIFSKPLSEKDANELAALIKSGYFSWRCKEIDHEEKDSFLLKSIAQIEKNVVSQRDMAIWALKEIIFGDEENIALPSEAIAEFLKTPGNHADYMKLFRSFVRHGYLREVFSLSEQIFNDRMDAVEKRITVFKYCESITENKDFVREQFYKNGPYKNEFWIHDNIGMCGASTAEVKIAVSGIKNVTISERSSIEEMCKGHIEFSEYCAVIKRMSKDNFDKTLGKYIEETKNYNKAVTRVIEQENIIEEKSLRNRTARECETLMDLIDSCKALNEKVSYATLSVENELIFCRNQFENGVDDKYSAILKAHDDTLSAHKVISYDLDERFDYWQSQYWFFSHRCKFCGGQLGLIKCKSCHKKN